MSYMKCPNMEAARIKIAAILKEHDLMGAVILAGQERSGFFQEVSPSWSCAIAEETPEGVGIRVRCRAEDYPSAQVQHECLAKTVNAFMGMLHVHQYIKQTIEGLMLMISRKFQINSVSSDEHLQMAVARKEEGA